MESFFKWITENPWAGYIFIGLLVAVVMTIVIACVVALKQGREFQLWPPKLGDMALVGLKNANTNTGEINIGLAAYNRDSHALDNKASRIRKAKHEVWMIGATMHYTLNNQKQLIIERVASGLAFYLLVADPDGVDYASTARCFGQDVEGLRKETEMTLNACKEISDQLQNSKGSFQVRLMDRVFTAGVYFFDPQDKEGSMFLVPHIPGTDAPITPGFEFRKVDGGLLDDYFGIYKGIWNGKGNPLRLS
jgi:hypothetical protein